MSNLQNADIGSDVEYQQKQRSRTEQNPSGKDQGRPQDSGSSGEHIDPANKKPQKQPASATDSQPLSPEPLSKVQQQPGVGEIAENQH